MSKIVRVGDKRTIFTSKGLDGEGVGLFMAKENEELIGGRNPSY
ncbi:hypothetical protein [Halobacillus amylolyticus]|nr:hypothetical protein [Halobacillus amylolyticus]